MCSSKFTSCSSRAHTRIHFPGSFVVGSGHLLRLWPIEFRLCPLKLPHKKPAHDSLFSFLLSVGWRGDTPRATLRVRGGKEQNHKAEGAWAPESPHGREPLPQEHLWKQHEMCIKPWRCRTLIILEWLVCLTHTAEGLKMEFTRLMRQKRSYFWGGMCQEKQRMHSKKNKLF